MRTLIVGHGGRESALAMRMATDSELHAFVGHENPTILENVARSGGSYALGDVTDPAAVAAFARERRIDIAMVSADEPLAAGVVDDLLGAGIRTVGPTRAGAEIEWNKAFAREVLAEVAPDASPRLRVARDAQALRSAVAALAPTPVVVKPSGLTGGKGVKVMGPHLADHDEALAYGLELLAAGHESVLVEERVDGAEFTIQAVSDGRSVVFPPSTYDYPYRFDGDRGPGTGGMGSLTTAEPVLPFMTPEHYARACEIIARVITALGERGRRFNGVMNSGFFATADGVKVIEFNARFGDPEAMNILTLLDGSWTHAMERICRQELSAEDVPLRPEASVVLYLVSPDYALGGGEPREFTLDRATVESAGCHAFFSSAVSIGADRYRTVGTSRAVALAASAPTLAQAHERVVSAAAAVPELEWRHDVGDPRYLEDLSRLTRPAAASLADAVGS